ncbi:uncharacterized protein KNAG_0H02200 [Huiozyma naganishii CBS 8797]|uniref:Protein transport protein SEC24 n=1 Tax=Huiozyma naganishii (strain ATCC MYA-139 / BCRC 22969 / CBS 8797 / KCTC 17520 / NBRC 10181 / NCYC 3082 / Yp74L-3) TaxID=1071383 RepID=J7RPJ2_HUIN7|nr:hypothetical protein KNAG_0H02200 [Kazachstania naganishii CBS 8797]CCK71633.1 hypothetical protein KNAG_0H02200 [Kazachstania naganishii CBS 8797]
MSHHRKRVYPQAQFQIGQQGVAPVGVPPVGMPPVAGGLAMGAGAVPIAGPGAGVGPGAGAGVGVAAGAASPVPASASFTPAQPQMEQLASGMAGMQLNGMPPQQMSMPVSMPMADPSAMYSQQQQMPQMNRNGSAVKPMNMLYPIDLLTELPPPIRDLSLPPPPLMVPPERMLVPSETANAAPEYVRCTLNAVPKSNSLLKKSKLPLALVIRPYQHLQDTVDPPPLTEDGLVVRCRRCRSYMNPFVTFLDQGARWRCNFCNLANDTPMQFNHSYDRGGAPGHPHQQQQQYANQYEKNEVRHAVMEYLAPKEYTLRQPPPSTYVFVMDVSQNAVKSGLLATTARSLLETLDFLPNHDGRTRVSILCVDNAIHYFNVPLDEEPETGMQMLDVADIDEPFLPRPNAMVVPLAQCRENLETLLAKIPEIFQYNVMAKFALGPALRAAFNLVKNTGGKIEIVSSTLPTAGVGKLAKRNEAGVANTPKESAQLLSCQDSFYKNFTIDCSKSQVTVDMFLATDDYIDFASLSNLARYTGGQTHFYPGFSAANFSDVTKFTKEFSKHLSMDISMEAVMRARGSTGVRMNSFYGHFFNRSSDLCAFSTMPRDQSYVFEMQLDENLMQQYCYVQIAVLLSLNTSQRRIRVITLALPTTESLSEVYASADQLAITAFFTQQAVSKAMNNSLDDARELISKAVTDVLATYKREIVVTNTAGGAPLRLCANMRMFPLLMHALRKHKAFRTGVVPSDHRASALNHLESAPLKYLIKNIYARVYSLHDMADEAGLPDVTGSICLPEPINATASLFERYGLYLIDNGTELFLWIGGDAVNELVMDVFGTGDILQVPIGKMELPIVQDSEFNERIRNIVAKVREHDDIVTYQTLYIVRGASLSEPVNHASAREVAALRLWATSHLVEDKILTSESYREFLQAAKSKISK